MGKAKDEKKLDIKQLVSLRIKKCDQTEKHVGEALLNYRKEETNLKQEHVAPLMGFKRASSVQRIEKGVYGISISKFLQLCEIYGADPHAILRQAMDNVQKGH